ncbi:MAG: D-alanyl-D-alanine carboxypeptidase [Candidatus Anoxychlamydiales bacterium]|nr:D-alanyl-D-alanine carboxypeptidase [Candidatus Anoxychlamydiales bacterium]NGX41086.1 D-alanyl-D-alanine carboxypeptidase [Candidatus Anoxychlamydiales bacterium]
MNKNFYKLVFCSLAIGGLVNSLAAIESSAIWMQKIAKIKNAPHDHNSIPNSCLSKKLRSYIKEISALHQEGILDGEFLVAKGSKVLLDLKSADVAEIAVDTIGAPQFMIGSTSKQFTAAALLKALYENMAHGESETEKTADVKRLLHLPLSHFLPEDAVIWEGVMPAWANKINLHQLLSHTSGLPNFPTLPEFHAMNSLGKQALEIPHSKAEIMKIVLKYPLNFTPGSKFSYCNTGYLLTAEVISAITGMPLSLYLKKAFFDPLGLLSTFSPETGNSVQLREFAPCFTRLIPQYSYDPACDPAILHPPFYLDDVSWVQGAGSIISTAPDLLKWNIALHLTKTILPNVLYELYITKNLNDYAYGICLFDICDGIMLYHPGRIGNYTSTLVYIPEDEITIIRLTHICIDSPTIEKEIDEWTEGLKDQIPDPIERQLIVRRKIIEKYPDIRGNFRGEEIFSILSKRITVEVK